MDCYVILFPASLPVLFLFGMHHVTSINPSSKVPSTEIGGICIPCELWVVTFEEQTLCLKASDSDRTTVYSENMTFLWGASMDERDLRYLTKQPWRLWKLRSQPILKIGGNAPNLYWTVSRQFCRFPKNVAHDCARKPTDLARNVVKWRLFSNVSAKLVADCLTSMACSLLACTRLRPLPQFQTKNRFPNFRRKWLPSANISRTEGRINTCNFRRCDPPFKAFTDDWVKGS